MSQRTRVLFVCIGNACRSQMAEAFARAYGDDVLVPASAGFSPPPDIPPDTLRAMKEKNLDLTAQFPKRLTTVSRDEFDLIVNMSGIPITAKKGAPVREWDVPDPIGVDFETHCSIRDQIETLVRNLILDLRRQPKKAREHKT